MEDRRRELTDDFPVILHSPLTGQPVIVAEARAKRPGGGGTAWEGMCPFCPGNEAMTPPEVWAVGREDGPENGPGWRMRLIPNLYPALVETVPAPVSIVHEGEEAFPARGRHEVLILTPDHHRPLHRMDPEGVAEALRALRRRYGELCSSEGVRQVVVMVNQGREAGASLDHPHAQIFALPLVPPFTQSRMERFSSGEGCPICREIERARVTGRMVVEEDGWAAFCPTAPRFSYEAWLAGRRHKPHITDCGEEELDSMAVVLRRLLGALSRRLSEPPYNLVLQCAPCGQEGGFHFHWEVLPRLGRLAGFELGTGIFINSIPSTSAASALKEVLG